MASPFLRRSGIAVALLGDRIGWRADVVVQVGIGNFHKEVDVFVEEWPGVKIIGFEPHPVVYQGLLKGKNPYPGEVHPFAISDSVGKTTLYSRRRHADGSSVHQISGGNVEYEVDTITLDYLFAPVRPRGRILLWLDCEGSEDKVLDGAKEFLPYVDVVNVEMTMCPEASGWVQPMEVHKRLQAAGFYAQWLHTQRISSGQNDWIYVRPSVFMPQYCCFPWEVERFFKEQQ